MLVAVEALLSLIVECGDAPLSRSRRNRALITVSGFLTFQTHKPLTREQQHCQPRLQEQKDNKPQTQTYNIWCKDVFILNKHTQLM